LNDVNASDRVKLDGGMVRAFLKSFDELQLPPETSHQPGFHDCSILKLPTQYRSTEPRIA
jgi:hypothetical protein